MGLSIFERGRLPRWLPVRQKLDTTEITDIPGAVAKALRASDIASRIPSGAKVALAVGSRGIDRIAEVTAAVVAELRRLGAAPFIVPAMGSHGGATVEGQVAMLAQLGVTEESVGAPIRASMETVVLGHVANGVPVYFDKIAATEADAVVPIARVKPHTDFKGPTESGLIKMIAIGLGKQHGADTNVINRYYRGPLDAKPTIQRIIVRDLTDDTDGNASGIGMADVVLRRAAERVDPVKTYMNCITAKKPEEARIPLTVENDRQALYVALACCIGVTPERALLARIQDTKHLDTLWVSEPWWEAELAATGKLVPEGEPEPIRFTDQGMFLETEAELKSTGT